MFDLELLRSTHRGYCVHGTHLLPIDHDHWNASTPATRCAIGIMPVAVSRRPGRGVSRLGLLVASPQVTGREWIPAHLTAAGDGETSI
jgi:hypothetical protein